jgi:ABC-type multidrug transport system ATPase subunit
LDSTNALKLIKFLDRLAKTGRTIISTIHQPSSKIFAHFDRVMLMVDGHIIYDGRAGESMEYFARLNLGVPLHSNPADHYMRLLNKEGMMVIYI